MKKKQKIENKDYFQITFIGNSKDGYKEKIIYPFENNEKKIEYETVCSMIWGGFPLDVGWATGTKLYKDTLNKLHGH